MFTFEIDKALTLYCCLFKRKGSKKFTFCQEISLLKRTVIVSNPSTPSIQSLHRNYLSKKVQTHHRKVFFAANIFIHFMITVSIKSFLGYQFDALRFEQRIDNMQF